MDFIAEMRWVCLSGFLFSFISCAAQSQYAKREYSNKDGGRCLCLYNDLFHIENAVSGPF